MIVSAQTWAPRMFGLKADALPPTVSVGPREVRLSRACLAALDIHPYQTAYIRPRAQDGWLVLQFVGPDDRWSYCRAVGETGALGLNLKTAASILLDADMRMGRHPAFVDTDHRTVSWLAV